MSKAMKTTSKEVYMIYNKENNLWLGEIPNKHNSFTEKIPEHLLDWQISKLSAEIFYHKLSARLFLKVQNNSSLVAKRVKVKQTTIIQELE